MANEITYVNGKPYGYTKYTIMTFSSWEAMQAFAEYIGKTKPSSSLIDANLKFKEYIEGQLRSGNQSTLASYGLFGRYPKSYEEAMSRNKFLYYEEYKKIKATVEKKIRDELQKSSQAETMKPKLVYNDKQIGEFIFDKAAMSLQPQLYFYSPSKKREVDIVNEKIIYEGKKMFLAADKSLVVYALKVDTGEGEEFVEIKDDSTLAEASKKGIVSCTSANKKVYLYKEKLPKINNAIKIIVGLTAGGFTNWTNDFYTGIAAVCCIEVLESLGYTVHIEVAVGGGRCGGCARKLNFGGSYMQGRRFFTFTAKSFDDPLNLDGLLYTLCDPSFHNIKFISLLNYFFLFFGDQLDSRGNPSATWHGIGESDMINPIGMYHKYLDDQKGNKNLIHFYIHQVEDEDDVVRQVTDLVLTCENKNREAYEKFVAHDFSNNK